MKKLLYSAVLTLSLMATSSCNFLDYDLNVDPNNPADVSLSQLLPSVEVSLAYLQGGDLGRYLSCWTQHHSGIDRQHLAIERYQILESDVDNYWNSAYATTLADLEIMLAKAEENGSTHYAGVAKVLKALTYSHIVDVFNNVPYSEAIQGDTRGIFKPAYDNGSDIYANLIALCDAAVADLAAVSAQSPGNDDLIFKGNRGKWTRMARSLKARLQLHRSKVNSGAYAEVLATIDAGAMSSNDDNAMVGFGASATTANPWYQFEDQRGDVVMGEYFINLMKSLNDPRITVFASENGSGEYLGNPAGAPTGQDNSRFGSFYGSSASPVPFMHYAEVKFMEAEAAFPTNKTRSAQAYNDAVKASLAMCGVSDAAYETANASETDATITLDKIMTQKYIACYSMPETFNDWRRTGIPALQPAQGQSQIARRWPPAQSERVYNIDHYQPATPFDRVFWDN